MFEKREWRKNRCYLKKKKRNRSIDAIQYSAKYLEKHLEKTRYESYRYCDKLESDASPAFFFPIIHSETEILSVTLHTLSTFNLYVLTTEHENISSPLIISLETGKEERGTKDTLYSIFFISFIYHFFTISKTLLFIETISPEDFSYYFPFCSTFL